MEGGDGGTCEKMFTNLIGKRIKEAPPDETPTEEIHSEEDHIAKEKAEAELRNKNLKNDELEDNIKLRKQYACIVFVAVFLWMFFVAVVIMLAGFNHGLLVQISYNNGIDLSSYSGMFNLPENVLITLVSGCSVNIIGLLAIVIRYLFPNPK